MGAMHRTTGKLIENLEEIEQAVDEVLDTIPGDRVMRAEYGSELFELTDIGMDATGKMRFASAAGDALKRFEPRVRIDQVVTEGSAGEMVHTVHGTVRNTNEQVSVKR